MGSRKVRVMAGADMSHFSGTNNKEGLFDVFWRDREVSVQLLRMAQRLTLETFDLSTSRLQLRNLFPSCDCNDVDTPSMVLFFTNLIGKLD